CRGICETCSGAVGSAEPGLQQAFGSWEAGACCDLPSDSSGGLSVSSRLVISRTLRPPGEGGTKKIRISNFARVCVLLGTRSLNRLSFVIAPGYPPAGGRCP